MGAADSPEHASKEARMFMVMLCKQTVFFSVFLIAGAAHKIFRSSDKRARLSVIRRWRSSSVSLGSRFTSHRDADF